MLPLVKTTSDHVPCVVQIGTNIPKPKVFQFETHWIDQPGWVIGLSKLKAQIKSYNEVLAILDKLEENRALNPP
jgi:hypothetical protein